MSLPADEIVVGGVYRVTGRLLKYPLRKVIAEQMVCGIRMLKFEAVGGNSKDRIPESTFAGMAIERVDDDSV